MARRLVTDLSPEMKIAPLLYVVDFIILCVGGAIFFLTRRLFGYLWLQGIYGILIGIGCVWAIIRPKHNPFKRNYQVIRFAFRRDKHVYHMVNKHELYYEDKDYLKEKQRVIQFDTTKSREEVSEWF